MFPHEVNANYRTTQLSLGPSRVFSASEGGGRWGDCIPSRRTRGARRSCFLPHKVDAGHRTPGRGGSREGRKPGIVSRRGEYESGDCVLSRRGCRPATVFPREGVRGAPAIVFHHEVDVGYCTAQLVTTDRPRRAVACKGLCVRDGGPTAIFFLVT